MLEALLHGEAEMVTRAVIEKARQSDLFAAKLIMDRILPIRRDRTVAFALPSIETAADAVSASAAIIEAVAAGDLSPAEATEISGLISAHLRIMEAAEFEKRLSALEARCRP